MYGDYAPQHRLDIEAMARLFNQQPWLVCGALLNGPGSCTTAMTELWVLSLMFFNIEVCSSHSLLVWCFERLINLSSMRLGPWHEAEFLTAGISDHSPILVKVLTAPIKQKKPFKFFYCWADHPEFLNLVARVWRNHVRGTPMFCLCQKLKMQNWVEEAVPI